MDWREARLGGHVNPGWVPLVDKLHERVLRLDQDVVVDQVKEKFGGLRYYYTVSEGAYDRLCGGPWFDQRVGAAIERLVMAAESASYWICEVCGRIGEPRAGGWVNTLCDKHHEQGSSAGEPAWKLSEGLVSEYELLSAAYAYLDRFVPVEEALADGFDLAEWCRLADELGVAPR